MGKSVNQAFSVPSTFQTGTMFQITTSSVTKSEERGIAEDQTHWHEEKAPAWLGAAMEKIISGIPGGFTKAAESPGRTKGRYLRANGLMG
ncbi:hypothetical protein [Pantoea vagans]|uniref:hypothetical protein n=1 Tax=Pantoea vagans TaxID=470934 RepID=UPI00109413AA|nr:hypothetical protein [Pantoea vagans]QCA04095.1 hypothetical protein EGO56_07955 [Pantoea vagans]